MAARTCTRSRACSTSAEAGAPPFHRPDRGRDAVGASCATNVPALPGQPRAPHRSFKKGLAKDPATSATGAAANCSTTLVPRARRHARAPAMVRRRRALLAAGAVVLVRLGGGRDRHAQPGRGRTVPRGGARLRLGHGGPHRLLHDEHHPAQQRRRRRRLRGSVQAEDKSITCVDPSTGNVDRTRRPTPPTALAVGAGDLDRELRRQGHPGHVQCVPLDPATGEITTRKLPSPGNWPNEGYPEIVVASGDVGSSMRAMRCTASTRPPAGTSRRSTAPASGRSRPAMSGSRRGASTMLSGGSTRGRNGGRDDPRRQPDPVRDRRRRRLGVGDIGRGVALADHSGSSADHQDDRRRDRCRVRRLRGRSRLGRQSRRRHGLTHRPPHRRGDRERRGRPGAGARGGCRLGMVGLAASSATIACPLSCSEVASGGAEPDVLIASGLASEGPRAREQRDMADAIRSALDDHGFRAGRHVVGYQSCDDPTVQAGQFDKRGCAANAHAFARTERIVAVLGPTAPSALKWRFPSSTGRREGRWR